jgi:hypothetical protein
MYLQLSKSNIILKTWCFASGLVVGREKFELKFWQVDNPGARLNKFRTDETEIVWRTWKSAIEIISTEEAKSTVSTKATHP